MAPIGTIKSFPSKLAAKASAEALTCRRAQFRDSCGDLGVVHEEVKNTFPQKGERKNQGLPGWCRVWRRHATSGEEHPFVDEGGGVSPFPWVLGMGRRFTTPPRNADSAAPQGFDLKSHPWVFARIGENSEVHPKLLIISKSSVGGSRIGFSELPE
jgi:hypothetical protein